MKKLNTILWMMAAAVIGLISCKKEDDTTPSNSNNTLCGVEIIQFSIIHEQGFVQR